MNKELCFIIENKKIYLEQILVDYMEIPLFFLMQRKRTALYRFVCRYGRIKIHSCETFVVRCV